MGDILRNYEKLALKAKDELEKKSEKNQIVIQVGFATCENAAGAQRVAQ